MIGIVLAISFNVLGAGYGYSLRHLTEENGAAMDDPEVPICWILISISITRMRHNQLLTNAFSKIKSGRGTRKR